MPEQLDENFYKRADEHIHLSNAQLKQHAKKGQISASMMYAVARFNAWISACGFITGEEMKANRTETIEYFAEQYRKMLEDNLDDYISNFDKYMKVAP